MRENDAFGAIVVTMEQYNGLFAEYPAKIASEAARVVGEVRQTMAATAKSELATVQRSLVQHVADASLELGRKRLGQTMALHQVGTVLALVVTFGSICLTAGYALASKGRPFWARDAAKRGAAEVLSVLLNAPAGWIVFLCLVPLAAYGARVGWVAASDATGRAERVLGWALVSASTLGALAIVILLIKFV